MNHSFTFFSKKNEIDNLQNEFNSQSCNEIEILTKKVNLSFPEDLLISHKRMSSTSLQVNIVTFLDIAPDSEKFIVEFTKKYKFFDIVYRYFHLTDNIVIGSHCSKGKVLSSYYFNDREVLCDILTDYMCAAHIALEGHEEVHIDGAIISEFVGTFKEKYGDKEFNISNHRIFLSNDEFAYLHMEYDTCQQKNDENNCYSIYGLSNATWTKNGMKDEDRLHLSEIISGNVVENFEKIIPYKFALECK